MPEGFQFDRASVAAIAEVVRKVLAEGKVTSRPPRTGAPVWPAPLHQADPTTTVGTTAAPEAAQTDHWDIYTDGSLKLTVCTRPDYFDAGDKVFYGYYRDIYIDHHGRITHVSPETRVIIDTTEAC